MTGETRTCAYCRAPIPEEAVRCPACDRWLDRLTQMLFRCRWEGRGVWIPRGATVDTDRCLICGSPDDVSRWRKKFTHLPYWFYLGGFFGFWFYLFCIFSVFGCIALILVPPLYFHFRNSDELVLSRCAPCRDWMRLNAVTAFMAAPVILFGSTFLGAYLGQIHHSPFLGWGCFFFGITALAVARIFWAPGIFVTCKGITPHETCLRFPSPETTRAVIEQRPL